MQQKRLLGSQACFSRDAADAAEASERKGPCTYTAVLFQWLHKKITLRVNLGSPPYRILAYGYPD